MKRYLVLLVASIFIVPLSGVLPTENTPVWYPQFVTLFSLLLVGCSLSLWDFNKYISIFTLLCWFDSVVVMAFNPRSIFITIMIYLCCLGSKAISHLKRSHISIIFKCYIVLSVLMAIMITLQYFDMCPMFQQTRFLPSDNIVAVFGSRNQTALFFTVISPIIFSICPILSVIPLLSIGLTATYTGFIAVIIGNLYLVKKSQIRNILIILFFAFAIIYSMKVESLPSSEAKNRLLVVTNTIDQVLNERAYIERGNVKKVITCNRWFGYGLGQFEMLSGYTQGYLRPQTHVYRHAHNDLIETLFDLGILGFLTVLLMIIDFVIKYIRSHKTKELNILFGCIMCQIVMSFGIFTVYTATSGMFLIVFYGLYSLEFRSIKWEEKVEIEACQRGTKVGL